MYDRLDDKVSKNVAIAKCLESNGWRVHGLDNGNVESLESWRPAAWNGFATLPWGPEPWQVWVFGITKSAIPTPGIKARISTPLVEGITKLVMSPAMDRASYFVAKVISKSRQGLVIDLWHAGRGLYSHRDHATRQNVETEPEHVLAWVKGVMERPAPALARQDDRPILKLGEQRLHNGIAMVITTGLYEGSCDIIFSGMPTAQMLHNLRTMGFRWARSRQCWYGPIKRLPTTWLDEKFVGGASPEQIAEAYADAMTSLIAERSV